MPDLRTFPLISSIISIVKTSKLNLIKWSKYVTTNLVPFWKSFCYPHHRIR